jgi:hypothetical protein
MRISLLGPGSKELTNDVVADAVSLVDASSISRVAFERLTEFELSLVYDWAMREHLHAAGDQVERRPRPSCLDLSRVVSALIESASAGRSDAEIVALFRGRFAEMLGGMGDALAVGRGSSSPSLATPPSLVAEFDPAMDWPRRDETSRDCAPDGSPALRRPRYRVRLDFTVELPPGSPMPTPTTEAVDSAALAMSGPPIDILPGSRISVSVARPRSAHQSGGDVRKHAKGAAGRSRTSGKRSRKRP